MLEDLQYLFLVTYDSYKIFSYIWNQILKSMKSKDAKMFFTTLLPLSLIYSNTHKAAADMHILYDANNDTLIVAEYCDKLAQHDTINVSPPLCDVITSVLQQRSGV